MTVKKPSALMEALMEGRVTERVPYALPVVPKIFLRRHAEELGCPLEEKYHLDNGERGVGPRIRGKPPWDSPWDNSEDNVEEEDFLRKHFSKYLPKEKIPGLRISEYGSITVPGSLYHLRRMIYPLRDATTVREIEVFPWPDIREEWRWEGVEEETRKYLDEGYWVVGHIGLLFETCWYLRSQEQFLLDLYVNPDVAEHLLDKMADDYEYKAARLAKMGVHALACGDDMGHQHQLVMHPDMLRKWILSRWERVIGAARLINRNIKIDFHTDGRTEEMIPDLLAIGVNAINPVQPECDDPEHLKKRFAPRLVLKGTLSSRVLTFGSPDDVKDEIRVRIDTAKRWGGLMITPNNQPDVNTPYENFRAFLEGCEDQ
jgi:uroporphyrinogen decarboxylase